MDVLNEYFGRFGPVSALQVNHIRHEAIITFSRLEDAEEALRHPVLNDPSIGLRPWRSKAGQRGPHEPAAMEVTADAAPPGAGAVPPVRPPGVLAAPKTAGNMMLEAGSLLEKKRRREEIEEKRKALLQGLTDQLKIVMARIRDPATTEEKRVQWQAMLASIKEKISALTPQQQQPPPPQIPAYQAEQDQPRPRPYPPGRTTSGPQAQRPPALRLLDLPAELRGPDAEVRLGQALGEGVAAVLMWSEDGSSCVVRFTERRHAEAAMQAQAVWGFKAEWFGYGNEGPPMLKEDQQQSLFAQSQDGNADGGDAPHSPDTESMMSDIPDQELMGVMEAAVGSAGAGDEELEGADIVPERSTGGAAAGHAEDTVPAAEQLAAAFSAPAELAALAEESDAAEDGATATA